MSFTMIAPFHCNGNLRIAFWVEQRAGVARSLRGLEISVCLSQKQPSEERAKNGEGIGVTSSYVIILKLSSKVKAFFMQEMEGVQEKNPCFSPSTPADNLQDSPVP